MLNVSPDDSMYVWLPPCAQEMVYNKMYRRHRQLFNPDKNCELTQPYEEMTVGLGGPIGEVPKMAASLGGFSGESLSQLGYGDPKSNPGLGLAGLGVGLGSTVRGVGDAAGVPKMAASLGDSSQALSQLGDGEPKSEPGLGGLADLGEVTGLGGTVRGVGEAGDPKMAASSGDSSEALSNLGDGEPKSTPDLGGLADLGGVTGLGGTVRGVGDAAGNPKMAASLGDSSEAFSQLGDGEPKSEPSLGDSLEALSQLGDGEPKSEPALDGSVGLGATVRGRAVQVDCFYPMLKAPTVPALEP